MSGWLMLYPVLGAYLDGLVAGKRAAPRRWAISSAALLVVLAAVALGQAATGYGKLLLPAAFAHGDPTLEAVAWTPLRAELKARGYLDGNMFVVAPNWMDAGRIDQAPDGVLPVTVFGDLTEAKNFNFSDDPKSWLGRDALVIGRTITPDTQARLGPYFHSIEELPPVSFGRSGMREIELHILLAKKLKMPLPSFDSKRRG
jgi:hypothetical protein